MYVERPWRMIAFLAIPLWAANESRAFVVVDNSAGPVVASNLWCTSTLDPSPVVYLPAGGADAIAQRATLLGQFAGIPGMQVVLGGALPGTLTIDTYSAYVDGDYGGATLVARYNDLVGGPTWTLPGPRWIQEINTNVPKGGGAGPYIDPRPGDDVEQGATSELPYYWTDKEAIHAPAAKRYTNGANFDLLFSDTPGRSCHQAVDWEAELFLSSENNFTYPQADGTHVITLHDGIRWGFELTPSIFKKFFLDVVDVIDTFTSVDLQFSPGNGLTQYNGTTFLPPLHAGGVFTNSPGQTVDSLGLLLDPNQGLLENYEFNVDINNGQSHLSVFINDLNDVVSPLEIGHEGEIAFDVQIPIIETFLAQNVSMTINLSEDLIVILDEDQTARTDTALFIGEFSTFDPGLLEFQVLGIRQLSALHSGVLGGDFDFNGIVDGSDFLKWQRGESPNPFSASDLADWETNYGTIMPPPALAAVPEPNTLLLGAMASIGLMLRRRCLTG